MSRINVFVAILAWSVALGDIRGASTRSEHPLVGHWASPHEELIFFGSGEFKFQEHGAVGEWKLVGRHLAFGVPRRGIRRDAEVIQLTRSRLVLLSSGKKQIYHRVEHG